MKHFIEYRDWASSIQWHSIMPRILSNAALIKIKKNNDIYGGKTITVTKKNAAEVVRYVELLKNFSRKTAKYVSNNLEAKHNEMVSLNEAYYESTYAPLYVSPRTDKVDSGYKSVRDLANVPEQLLLKKEEREMVKVVMLKVKQSVLKELKPLIDLQNWIEETINSICDETERQQSLKDIIIDSAIYNQTYHELFFNAVLGYDEEPLLVGSKTRMAIR